MVLVTDERYSFAINNYKDGGMEWNSVRKDGMGDGLSGVPAQVGFNDACGENYFVVPNLNVSNNTLWSSNVGIPGKWIFKLALALCKFVNFMIHSYCINLILSFIYIRSMYGSLLLCNADYSYIHS